MCGKDVGDNSIRYTSCSKWMCRQCSSEKGSLQAVATVLFYRRCTKNSLNQQNAALQTNVLEEALLKLLEGKVYGSCVRSCMTYASETWPMNKEHQSMLKRTEMRMVRWMCGTSLKEKKTSSELRDRMGKEMGIQTH